jgi:hypothetical protein
MPLQGRQNPGSNKGQVGYFCHLTLGEKHVGGILITNQIGVPIEFKYTEPIHTTKLHKILYGQVLEKHLHQTVIRESLAKEIRSEPEYYIAPYEEKEFIGTIAGREMIALQRSNTSPQDRASSFVRIRDNEAVVQLEEGPLLRMAFSTCDDAIQHQMVTWLQEMGRTMDVLEPIDRVFSALKSLCGEEKKL